MRYALLLLPMLMWAAPPDITRLRWMGPEGSRPGTFREWHNSVPEAATWKMSRLPTPSAASGHRRRESANSHDRLRLRTGPLLDSAYRVDILVQDSLYPRLSLLLDTLILDLALEGYQAVAFSVSGTSAESLRAFLSAERDSGLAAAVLVGNLPVAWFQMIDDWNNNGRRDPDEGYEEFPCDLFFMDLDGTWEDNYVRYDTLDSLVPGHDGIYDLHHGDLAPEIGISRLFVAPVGRADSLLSLYFRRAHAYRTGNLPVTDRALVYIDDDWVPGALEWDEEVGMLYPVRVSIWDEETTRVADYRPRIDTAAYQWIALCAHSWPGGHAMKYSRGTRWDWFYATAIPALNPQACFYNLFACSNLRFTEPGYCGGMYVFRTATGLGAVGSTKTGSMLEFQDFYLPLADGAPLALAFREWFWWRAADGIEPWERSWFYGMSLAGDGMLRPRVPAAITETSQPAVALQPVVTIVRRILFLPHSPQSLRSSLWDMTGRPVLPLSPGQNDLSSLPAGVYFLKSGNSDSTLAPQRILLVR